MNESVAAPASCPRHTLEGASGRLRIAEGSRAGVVPVAVAHRDPGARCVEATRGTRTASAAVVMLVSPDDPDPRLLAALRAGAAGVMRTDSAPSDLIRALNVIGRGCSYARAARVASATPGRKQCSRRRSSRSGAAPPTA